jgi:hypothetical protein
MRNALTIPIQPWRPIPAAPSFPIHESKLVPPFERPGMVSRANLLDRLEASGSVEA